MYVSISVFNAIIIVTTAVCVLGLHSISIMSASCPHSSPSNSTSKTRVALGGIVHGSQGNNTVSFPRFHSGTAQRRNNPHRPELRLKSESHVQYYNCHTWLHFYEKPIFQPNYTETVCVSLSTEAEDILQDGHLHHRHSLESRWAWHADQHSSGMEESESDTIFVA